MKFVNEKGITHIFFLIAVLGIVAFLVVASSADFKNRLFGQLFQKPQSRAASDPISGPITPTPTPTPQATSKRVFVTKAIFSGNLGGFSGADQKCMAASSNANLVGTFKAWLSSSTISASSRLTHATVPYKLLNGTTIANNWAGLTKGYIRNPINITETGAPANGAETLAVWTNTNGFGTIFSQYTSCNNWTYGPEYISGSDPYAGKSGMMNSNSAWWTADNYTSSCARKSRLYCFEQ